MTYEIVFAVFAFVLGAVTGSFLNVWIYRLPRDLSADAPQSPFCPQGRNRISWRCHLPLVSWLARRGKCGNCGAPISFRSFGVELLTALLFLMVWMHVWPANWFVALSLWILVSLLVVATFIDFEHFIIPDEITWGGTIAGVMVNLLLAPLTAPRDDTGDSGEWFAALAGLAIVGGGVWLGLRLGGPLKAMRTPWKFFICALLGMGLALWVEYQLGGRNSFLAIRASLIGAVAGYLLIWTVVEGGKLAFGKKRVAFAPAQTFLWTRHDHDADLVCGEEKRVWSEFFCRESDCLRMKCPEIVVAGERFSGVAVEFYYDRVQIGGRTWELDQLDEISGSVTEMVIPREAMGFGDVKFMTCIGAFLGWKAVLFTLSAASGIGVIVSVLAGVVAKNKRGAEIPFGPYLAAGALLWVFYEPEIAWFWAR